MKGLEQNRQCQKQANQIANKKNQETEVSPIVALPITDGAIHQSLKIN